MNILDLFFPKRCVNCKKVGDYICPDCFSRLSFDTEDICPECSRPAISGITHPKCKKKYSLEGTFTAVVFNKTAKKLLYQFKYRPYLTDLKVTLTDLMHESLIQNEEFERVYSGQGNRLLIVPVPLYKAKQRMRGYNQAEILGREMAGKLGLPMTNALLRMRDTRSQVGLDKTERRENLREAFGLKDGLNEEIRDKSVCLIDDVLTTGATLSEAGKALRRAGAEKVWGIALAKEK